MNRSLPLIVSFIVIDMCTYRGYEQKNGGLTDIDDLLFIPSIVIPPSVIRGKGQEDWELFLDATD